MSTAIKTFQFPLTLDTKHMVRITDQNGDPWFVAKDVCDVLGFSDTNAGTRHLDEDEKMTVNLTGISPTNPMVTLINESGLYSLILKSRKEEAKRFKKWVTGEVLPTIRKEGSYSIAVAIPNFNNPVEAARAWADQMEKRMALESQNQIMRPKAQKYDKYMGSDGTIDLTRAAKTLGFDSAQALGQYLRVNLNWLFATTKKVTPRAHVVAAGYMTCKLRVNGKTGYGAAHGRITPKGFGFLMEHFGIKEEEAA
jgi:prophage antirepressor-like protein